MSFGRELCKFNYNNDLPKKKFSIRGQMKLTLPRTMIINLCCNLPGAASIVSL
jgi:hypothetical protein